MAKKEKASGKIVLNVRKKGVSKKKKNKKDSKKPYNGQGR